MSETGGSAEGRVVLGFDFGMQYIGVAVGQTITGTASALVTLNRAQKKIDWSAVAALIADWSPERLLVGMPPGFDVSDQPLLDAVRRFARRLNGRFNLPVEFVDEHLSSYEARQIIYADNKQRGRGERVTDQYAAQVIVQTWLNENM